MTEKKYYSERKDIAKAADINFDMLKSIFLMIYENLEDDLYFQEATGYYCVDRGHVLGLFRHDIEAYIYMKLKLDCVWPIRKNIEKYDEATLFTVIEFLYDYVSEPVNKWYHQWENCGWHCSEFNKENGQIKYRAEINDILKDYNGGHRLTSDGEILEIAPTGLETLVEEIIETDEPHNIDSKIHLAVSKFSRYNATIDDKKEAVRTLADVLEYLKKEGIRLQSRDESDLFNIINNFDIRHHNRDQQGDYDKEIWYDWMFYTFLASIYTLLELEE